MPHQPCPLLRPVRTGAQREQAGPRQPIDVRAGQSTDRQHIGNGPRLPRQSEDPKLVRQFLGRGQIVIDAVDKPLGPAPGAIVHSALDFRSSAGEGENPQAAVDIEPHGTDHFGQASVGQHPHQPHLAKSKMGMHEAQREGRVIVAVRFDERNLVFIPVDVDAVLQRQGVRREHRQPIGQAGRLRQGGQRRAASHEAAGRREAGPPGRANSHAGVAGFHRPVSISARPWQSADMPGTAWPRECTRVHDG